MKLDRTLISDIKKQANGDMSLETRAAFLEKAEAAAKFLSTLDVDEDLVDDAIKRYGRVAVGACIAATIDARKRSIGYFHQEWAQAFLTTWKNRTFNTLNSLYVQDNRHPTAICGWANKFMWLTRGEEE